MGFDGRGTARIRRVTERKVPAYTLCSTELNTTLELLDHRRTGQPFAYSIRLMYSVDPRTAVSFKIDDIVLESTSADKARQVFDFLAERFNLRMYRLIPNNGANECESPFRLELSLSQIVSQT